MSTHPMSRYQQAFAQSKRAFIPFTLLGWPTPELSEVIIKTMIDARVTALELGMAFSDPIADGPVIQAATHQVLRQGFSVKDAYALLSRVRAYAQQQGHDLPIGLLVYANTVWAKGLDSFCEQAKTAGADGILIADLPPESAQSFLTSATAHQLAPILMVSPLTHSKRLAMMITLLQAAPQAFWYVVSRLGITGTEARFDNDLAALLAQLKSQSALPCCVGFGISTPQQAAHMQALGADGVIVGSRIFELVLETDLGDTEALRETLLAYFRSFLT